MKPSCLWVASLQVSHLIAQALFDCHRQACKCKVTCAKGYHRVGGGSEGSRWDRVLTDPSKMCFFWFQGGGQLSRNMIELEYYHMFSYISNYFNIFQIQQWIYIHIYIYIIYIYEIKTMISANSTLKVVCWETLPSFWRPTGMHLATRLFVCRLSGFQLTNDRLYWAGFKIQLWVLNPNNFVS